jgi:hypothetical protein
MTRPRVTLVNAATAKEKKSAAHQANWREFLISDRCPP